jgi:two-component system, chemotaxis family, sensor kinase Cph1
MTRQEHNKNIPPALPGEHIYRLDPTELRRQAEKKANSMEIMELECLSPEMQHMVHELQVHQIELEMQNEELRRTQAELEASRAVYFDLYDLAPVGYFTLSNKGLIQEINLTAAKMLGLTRDVLVMQRISRFILKEDQDIFYLHLKKFIITSEPQECDLRMQRDDTTMFWTRIEISPIKIPDGSPAFRVVMIDITARKQTEEALFRSEAHFKLLAETSEQLIVWKNVEVIIGELCRKTMEHLGCDIYCIYLTDPKAGKLHLSSFAGISDERAKEIEWVDIGASINGQVVLGSESIIRENISGASNTKKVAAGASGIQAYASLPMLIHGVHIGTLFFGTRMKTGFSPEDTTLMKTVAAHMAAAMQRTILVDEIQGANDNLESRIHLRTMELEKMVEALKHSNVALEDFVHIASHDLQEPLRKIMTFAERLANKEKTDMDEVERYYSERMQKAAARMRSLILELLKYSRIASSEPGFKIIELRGPVEDAVRDLSVLLEECGGHVDIDKLPEVEANDVQMRQLFENLIGNALKYRGDEMPIIRIYNVPSSVDHFHQIHVEDNGIGFDEIFLDKIFKPFQRLHGLSSPYKGTGMGLAICKKIAEFHGGSITAKSEPGKGSTFIVRLPELH